MMKALKTIIVVLVAIVVVGCCIDSRRICRESGRTVQSDHYCVYTNDVLEAYTNVYGKLSYRAQTKYYTVSYNGGPFRGSILYPGTREDLNILALWSYSSAASGNYMNNIITMPLYPLFIVALPIEFVIDTVLIPWDLYNSPQPTSEWKLQGNY